MKLAHLSDLHILALDGAVPLRLLNKRLTGYVNLRLARAHRHRLPIGVRIAEEIARHRPDHVAVTGDVSNLALEQEFAAVARFVREHLGLPAHEVSIVPGNHDAYTRGSYRSRRFATELAHHVTTDIERSPSHWGEPFPYVRLRGPLAIIGLSTGVPRPPFVAAGELGELQRTALGGLLDHAEVKARTVVLLQHHPLHPARTPLKTWLEGLRDAAEERRLLDRLPGGLLLHGHLHRRVVHSLRTRNGQISCVGCTSATLAHPSPERRAGFHLYDFDDGGALRAMRAFHLTADLSRIEEAQLPAASLTDHWDARRAAPGW